MAHDIQVQGDLSVTVYCAIMIYFVLFTSDIKTYSKTRLPSAEAIGS